MTKKIDPLEGISIDSINIDLMDDAERTKLYKLLKHKEKLQNIQDARNDFLTFVKTVWPQVIIGPHHLLMAQKFQEILDGKLKRLMISVPPRSGKSEFTSWLLPAFIMGKLSESQILHASHTVKLVEGFGRRVRDLINSPIYQEIFPTVKLKKDMKSATSWGIEGTRGVYKAFGTGSALAGVGGNFIILDDIVSEKTVTDGGLDAAWQWYQEGLYTRLMPHGVIIAVATRWSKADPLGRIQGKMKSDPNYEKWDVINIPALNYEEGHYGEDDRITSGHWEEFWSVEDLLRIKSSVGHYAWMSQYMGDPTGRGTGIISGEDIVWWEGAELPRFEYVLQSYDTAFEKDEANDPSSFTMWGVFKPRGVFDGITYDGTRACVMCIGHVTKNWDYPELKKFAMGKYRAYTPDNVLIEEKASGKPMIQELQRAGVPVLGFSPSIATGNKKARYMSVSTMFTEHTVFFPKYYSWAEELAQHLLDYPNGEIDDPVDSTTQALAFIRKGQFVVSKDDEDAVSGVTPSMKPRCYYNC